MKVQIVNDDFLNECYGLNIETRFPDGPVEFFVDYENAVETPPDLINEYDDIEHLLSIENQFNHESDFKDISYFFEIHNNHVSSNIYASISNLDFWFNFQKNESILSINESEISLVKYMDILQNSTIKEFFINNLTDEIERLDQLELFNSFRELIELQQLFKRYENDIWCTEIIQLTEIINQKVGAKINQFCTEHKLIAHTILFNRTDNEQKHLNRIKSLLFTLSDQERQSIFHSIISLFGLNRNAGDGEIHFFKYVRPGYYNVALTITLYHFEKLINCLSDNQTLKITSDSIRNANVKRIDKPSIIPVDRKLFSKELFHLVSVTTETGNKFKEEEIDNLCQIIVNVKIFNASKPEIIKFNNWLDDKSNLILFQLFLSYISSNSTKVIKRKSYRKLSESISSKFAQRGLSKDNLLNKYINSDEPNFKLTESNKSSIAFVRSKIITAERNLQNGIVKKMLKQILSNF
jgi:hypothetical protein